ncbi:hypothetical protein KKC13_06685 [bacterium]|nr:hypothetical protein [bacterium]MBU1958595.1 hypothetical protein [bacterium]
MHNIKFVFIALTLFTIIFQGCGNDTSSTKTYPTAIAESASIVSTDPNATMAPSEQALKVVANEIGNILKTHIVELNEKEATTFTKETNYCDVSGEKNLENSGNIEKIVSTTNYKLCRNEKSIQDGNIEISYALNNSDGKFPKILELRVQKNYTFNKMVLKKDVFIKSNDITYNEDGSVKSMNLDIGGDVEYNYQTLTLKNLEQTINF